MASTTKNRWIFNGFGSWFYGTQTGPVNKAEIWVRVTEEGKFEVVKRFNATHVVECDTLAAAKIAALMILENTNAQT